MENQSLKRDVSIVTLEDWDRRKEFACFTNEDAKLLKELRPLAESFVDKVVEELYAQFMKFDETRVLLKDKETINRLKTTQKEYFLGLTSGKYGREYLENRIHIGRTHQRVGLSPQWYMGAYLIYMQLVIPRIMAHIDIKKKKDQRKLLAMLKIINLDQELAVTTYIAASNEVISRQAEEIMEISTPIVQVWEGVVALPLIGTLDTQRTQQIMERLLEHVVKTNSLVALIDITGVPTIDTATAQHLIETINSVRLLGAQVIITGVRPAIAQTIVHLGINLSDIITRSSLAAGLQVALDILSLKVVSKTKTGKEV